MSRNPAEVFIDRWTNDPSFAHQLKTNPISALKGCGIDHDDEAVQFLRDVGPETSVEELQTRISKWWLVWHGGW